MIKHIIFAVTLIFSILSSLYSMEPVIQSDKDTFLNLQLRSVELINLLSPKNDKDKQDCQSFINILSDFDANVYAYGFEVANHLKSLDSEALLDTWIKQQANKLLKMPENKKIMFHWIIEDEDNNNAFVGRMCLHTYIEERPQEYADTWLVAFGLTITADYRNKKVFSSIAPTILDKIMNDASLQDACFCFDTDAENIPMQKAATKIDAQKIHSWERTISIGDTKMTRNSDLFIIPKKLIIQNKQEDL